MNPSYLEPMDSPLDWAVSEHPDKDMIDGSHYHSNSLALACSRTHAPQPGQFVEHGMYSSSSMGIPNPSRSTPWSGFQAHQQPSRTIGYSHIHIPEPNYSSQPVLTADEIALVYAHRQTLNMSQESRSIPEQEHTTAAYNNTTPQMHLGTDVSNVGHSNLSRSSFSNMAPHDHFRNNQITYDGNYPQDIVSNIGHTQPSAQSVIDPSLFNSHTQDLASHNLVPDHLQQYSSNAPYLPTNSEQHMPLRLLSPQAPVPITNVYGQQNSGVSTQDVRIQEAFMQNDDTVPSTGLHTFQPPFVNEPCPNMASSITTFTPPDSNLQFNNRAFNSLPSALSSGHVGNQANTSVSASQRFIGPPIPPETLVTVGKATRRQAKSAGKSRSDPYDKAVKPVPGLEGMHSYQNPAAELEYSKTLARTRAVKDKIDRACFGCILRKGKCTRSSEGPCSGCKALLKKHSYLTSVPKFTCTLRTKLADMQGFPVPSEESRRCWRVHFNLPVETPIKEDKITKFLAFEDSNYLGIRNILDILDPGHMRKVWPKFHEWFPNLSYGFSMLRWRGVIICLDPTLEVVMNVLEYQFHHWLVRSLTWYDSMKHSADSLWAALLLTVIYEGLKSLESSHLVENSAKEYLESTLLEHILFIYLKAFGTQYCISAEKRPTKISRQQAVPIFVASLCFSFSRTRKYIPFSPSLEFAVLPPMVHRQQSVSTLCLNTENWLYVLPASVPPEADYLMMLLYAPPQFCAAFGFSTEELHRIGNDTNDPYHRAINDLGKLISTSLIRGDEVMHVLYVLSLSPIALSMGVKVILDHMTVSTILSPSQDRERRILLLFVSMRISVAAFLDIADSTGRRDPNWMLAFSMQYFQKISFVMRRMSDDSGYINHLRNRFAEDINAILGLFRSEQTTAASTSAESAPTPSPSSAKPSESSRSAPDV